ncbi:MAG: FprA family A-type flavoprotein [Chloroflexi bacterium]|nr:FprA family A-type flavoprotein [Chloroflexota bacterium]
MKPFKILEDLYYVGMLDPDRKVFDVIMPLDRGTTYNSYLIQAEKVAIVETVTVTPAAQEEFLSNVRALVNPKDIGYVVLNHLEPDHSGALEILLAQAPQARVVVSRSGEHFVKNLLNRDVQPLRMGDGDSLDLGDKTLRFITAPFVHWPDTMLTYLVEDKVLFPCDFLGCHFCDPRLYDDLVEDFRYYFRYYFDVIMRPYKEYSFKALKKLEGLDIALIAPSHGPILRTNPRQYIERYREWARPSEPSARKKALVLYASAYGNTRRMAEAVARGLGDGSAEVEIFDIGQGWPKEMLDKIEAADGLVIGSPTFVGDALKPIWDLLSSFVTIKVKGKVGAAFGSYGWSGEGVPLVEQRLKDLKLKVPEPGIRVVLTPTEEDLTNCREFGRRLAQDL